MAETIEYKKISELPVAERFDGTEYVPHHGRMMDGLGLANSSKIYNM